jgi:hypothetical protein
MFFSMSNISKRTITTWTFNVIDTHLLGNLCKIRWTTAWTTVLVGYGAKHTPSLPAGYESTHRDRHTMMIKMTDD